MAKEFVLQKIENDRSITAEKDGVFLFELQRAMLLALKELGMLNDRQYHFAEDKLCAQYRRGGVG